MKVRYPPYISDLDLRWSLAAPFAYCTPFLSVYPHFVPESPHNSILFASRTSHSADAAGLLRTFACTIRLEHTFRKLSFP